MGKLFSLNKIGIFFRGYFQKKTSKMQTATAGNVIYLAERTSHKASQKVTSPQIEAYYKRYGKCTNPAKKPEPAVKQPELKFEVDTVLKEEGEAYNNTRFINVSAEALKGLENNFEQKRNKVKEIILADSDLLPPEYLKMVRNIKTPEDLAYMLRAYSWITMKQLDHKYKDAVQKYLNTKVISLKTQQEAHRDQTRISNVYLEIVKAVTEPTKDKNTIAVEDYLKTRFNMDYVHLENIDEAKRILKTIILANKYKLPIPKNIIISPYTPLMATGTNCPHSAQEFSVVIQNSKEVNTMCELAYSKMKSPQTADVAKSLREDDKKWFSTDDELQRYLHEFVHGRQFVELFLPHAQNPIPAKYTKTVNNLGIYARTSRKETDAELKTKEILRSLSDEERELLSYLER